jgi:GAF domain-containing protein
MISSLDTPTIVQQLCEIVVDVLGCDCCHVALLDTKSNAFINTAGSGDTSEQWELLRLSPIPRGALATLEDQFLDGEETQAVRVAIPARSVLDTVLQQTGIRTALFVPLRRGAQDYWGVECCLPERP